MRPSNVGCVFGHKSGVQYWILKATWPGRGSNLCPRPLVLCPVRCFPFDMTDSSYFERGSSCFFLFCFVFINPGYFDCLLLYFTVLNRGRRKQRAELTRCDRRNDGCRWCTSLRWSAWKPTQTDRQTYRHTQTRTQNHQRNHIAGARHHSDHPVIIINDIYIAQIRKCSKCAISN